MVCNKSKKQTTIFLAYMHTIEATVGTIPFTKSYQQKIKENEK